VRSVKQFCALHGCDEAAAVIIGCLLISDSGVTVLFTVSVRRTRPMSTSLISAPCTPLNTVRPSVRLSVCRCRPTQRRCGKGEGGNCNESVGNPLPSSKFWVVGKLSENLFLVLSFRLKMQHLGPKTPILGKFEVTSFTEAGQRPLFPALINKL